MCTYMWYTLQGQNEEYLLSRSISTKPGTYYQGWFMYMRYTQGQNKEYVLNQVLTKHRPLYVCTQDKSVNCPCRMYNHLHATAIRHVRPNIMCMYYTN